MTLQFLESRDSFIWNQPFRSTISKVTYTVTTRFGLNILLKTDLVAYWWSRRRLEGSRTVGHYKHAYAISYGRKEVGTHQQSV